MNVPSWLHFRVVLGLLVALLAACDPSPQKLEAEYWVWAGILPEDAPADAEILLYQGNVVAEGEAWRLDHKGVYPHPLSRPRIALVFRLHELCDPQFIAYVVDTYIAAWQRHDVQVSGVQLDFDSPSARLSNYATFLAEVHELVPARLSFSITGLGAWLAETDKETLADLHDAVDYVAYQFYVGRSPLERPDNYVRFLRKNPHSFKVGLLADNQTISPGIFTGSPGFKGVIYFLQR